LTLPALSTQEKTIPVRITLILNVEPDNNALKAFRWLIE